MRPIILVLGYFYTIITAICLIHANTEIPQGALYLHHKEQPSNVIIEQQSADLTDSESLATLFAHAQTAINNKDFYRALEWYECATRKYPYCAQAHHNKGVILTELARFDDALKSYFTAIVINPYYVKASLHLADTWKQQGNNDQSLLWYKYTVLLDPQSIEAHTALARLYSEQQKLKKAINHYVIAHSLHPTDNTLTFELANTYTTAHEPVKALELYNQLLQLAPQSPSLLYNVGYTLKKMGKIEKAIHFYEAAIRANPQHAEAHFSLGLLYLSTGNWEKGWQGYEWRWKRNVQVMPINLPGTRWSGENLDHKKLLVVCEQGFGDTFQFSQLLRMIKQRTSTCHITLAVQRQLKQLMSLCPFIDTVITREESPSDYDYWIPLLSIPSVINLRIDDIQDSTPYIFADNTLITHWRSQLDNPNTFKIGICYHTNPHYGTPFLRTVMQARSIPLSVFAPLADIPGVELYCLQKQTGMDQLPQCSFKLHTFTHDFDESHGRFMDTAAVIACMDLIISADTSVAHLAAALGIPTWTLLQKNADWRWMLDRHDTPWYRTMRLFRQQEQDNWSIVIQEVKSEIEKILTNRP